MNSTEILIGVVILLLLYIYRTISKAYSFFDKNGIPYIKPNFIFGNVKDWILMRKPLAVVHADSYRQLEPNRFAGVFISLKKSIMIRDPDLIRNVLTKDFSYFQDRGIKRTSHEDKLGLNLFQLTGDEWKNLRIKLTGTFTTGKMKMMFPLVEKCGTELNNILQKVSNEDFNIKDICARYTTDVIGSCAFGLDINSLDHPDSEFRKMGSKIFQASFRNILRFIFPSLAKYFPSIFINQSVQNFFTNLVETTIKYREENKITRGDFLDLLIALKNETDLHKSHDNHDNVDLDKFLTQIGEKHGKSNIEMTEELLTAQCFIFFLAGFETSSSTLGFMLLELAQNQQIQDKLRQEIVTVLQKNDNYMNYDVLKEMKYLDMVIAETLRKYPIAGQLLRECTKTYKIPDSKVILEQGTSVVIPVYGIHHDIKYYEKPHEFYPEHFTDEKLAKRPHYTYLPFGEGPRVCIGERFAMMQIKVGAVNLLKNFSYRLSPKTKMPIQFTPNSGLFDIKGGIWLQCRKF